jgi:hypothetical protein
MKWCVISDATGPIASEWAEEGSINPGEGKTVAYYKGVQKTKVAAMQLRHTCPKKTALLALDASAQTEPLKTILEYLQSQA